MPLFFHSNSFNMRQLTLLKHTNFFLVLVHAVLLIGCKKQMAVFSYHPESFPASKKTRSTPFTNPNSSFIESTSKLEENASQKSEVFPSYTQTLPMEGPKQIGQDWPKLKRKKKVKISKQPEQSHKKPLSIFLRDEKPEKRKRVMQNTFFNDQVKIGGLFLGGAIILSLFNLSGLALLFGVASLLLLFLGLKKYFRKQRRKKAFRLKNK